MKICVVGDLLLDIDVHGTSNRLCPDAPVPVIDTEREDLRAGGAGLVATLLAADGHDVTLVTALASDAGAARLREALAGVAVSATELHGPTPTKTRLRANGAQVARMDTGCLDVRNGKATPAMLEACVGADAVVVADYGHGLLEDSELRRTLQTLSASVPVVWDPHPRGADPVPGVAAVTPNLGEALGASGTTGTTVGAAALAARRLLQRWQSRAVVVTLAEGGALMQQASADDVTAPLLVPAPQLSVADPCGAGDRFASALAVLLAEGRPISTAVQEAVAATARFLAGGGVTSMPHIDDQHGSRTALPDGTVASNPPAKTGDAGTSAFALAEAVHARGGTVVATGGCFDVLHAGHIRMLAQARKLGDCLIVLLNSDESVTRMKGPERPIVSEAERAEMLHALVSVDAVVVFSEDTPAQTLQMLRPDLWVKGGDYSVETLSEAGVLGEWGGQALTLAYHAQHSTTLLAQALARAGH